uniref:Uncharacterized protein n=1 Tax=Arundo donax TaxID=35708 RepID=A0A0A9FWR0_ARUDO
MRLHHGDEVVVGDVQRDAGGRGAGPLDLAEAADKELVVRPAHAVHPEPPGDGVGTRCTSALNAHDASTAATAAATIHARPMASLLSAGSAQLDSETPRRELQFD